MEVQGPRAGLVVEVDIGSGRVDVSDALAADACADVVAAACLDVTAPRIGKETGREAHRLVCGSGRPVRMLTGAGRFACRIDLRDAKLGRRDARLAVHPDPDVVV